MSEQPHLDIGILKRTTFVVKNAKESAKFYTSVFGWTIWYDNKLMADPRFPPFGNDTESEVHLVILQAKDPKLGKLGLLEFVGTEPDEIDVTKKTRVHIGDPILVIESEDIEGVYSRAIEMGANVITKPVDWYVPGPKPDTKIHLRTVCLFDPNGIYMEVSDHPSRKNMK